ncbi:MAG: AbrB/MazE/SpoVT family DNA-binding domain-containing protein [Candidatus Heimdallarchaeota archaeon]
MINKKSLHSTINLNISENHNLLYYNIPKEIVQKLDLNDKDLLEYDIREDNFFVRKKGSQSLPVNTNNNIFSGLLVKRNITRNNTVLRTNLPKEVAQPLIIAKGEQVEITIEGKVIVGRKISSKE